MPVSTISSCTFHFPVSTPKNRFFPKLAQNNKLQSPDTELCILFITVKKIELQHQVFYMET